MIDSAINFTLNMTAYQQVLPNSSTMGFKEICDINQIAMLNQLQKMPTNLFMMLCVTMVLLIIYSFILPRIKLEDDWHKAIASSLLTLIYVFLTFAIVFCASLTFKISEQGWSNITIVAFGLAVLALVWRVWHDKDRIINFIKKEKK